MITICMICQAILKKGPGKGVSHGYCDLHGLEVLETEGLITLDEQRQLNTMRFEKRLDKNNILGRMET